MLKGYRFTLLYLIIAVGMHLLYRTSNFKGSIAVVEILSILFAVVSLIRFLLAKDNETRVAYFLVALLLGTIAAKLDYQYHNKIISFGLISAAIYFAVAGDFTLPNRRAMISTAILTLAIVLIPDKQIFSYTYYRLLTNGEQLTWNDFKGIPNRESKYVAHLRANILYEINKVYDYPPAIVMSYVEPYESWVKDRTDEPSFDLLLTHEQGHFYIAEYCARLANDSLATTWANKRKSQSVINTFYYKMDSIQASYDSLTKHGFEVAIQFEQTKDLKRKLVIPSLSSDLENIPYNLNRDTTNAR